MSWCSKFLFAFTIISFGFYCACMLHVTVDLPALVAIVVYGRKNVYNLFFSLASWGSCVHSKSTLFPQLFNHSHSIKLSQLYNYMELLLHKHWMKLGCTCAKHTNAIRHSDSGKHVTIASLNYSSLTLFGLWHTLHCVLALAVVYRSLCWLFVCFSTIFHARNCHTSRKKSVPRNQLWTKQSVWLPIKDMGRCNCMFQSRETLLFIVHVCITCTPSDCNNNCLVNMWVLSHIHTCLGVSDEIHVGDSIFPWVPSGSCYLLQYTCR